MKLFIIFLLLCSSVYSAEILKEEHIKGAVTAYKIKFEEHTYIVFWNFLNTAGNGWFHDLDCKKCEEIKSKAALQGNRRD